MEAPEKKRKGCGGRNRKAAKQKCQKKRDAAVIEALVDTILS